MEDTTKEDRAVVFRGETSEGKLTAHRHKLSDEGDTVLTGSLGTSMFAAALLGRSGKKGPSPHPVANQSHGSRGKREIERGGKNRCNRLKCRGGFAEVRDSRNRWFPVMRRKRREEPRRKE